MATIMDIRNPWRALLRTPASWRGVIFHVETGARLSGRRTVVHEYPKRDDPYAEDMGMHARRLHFSGYLIYRPDNAVYNYTVQRTKLINALEQDGPGQLIHPVFWPNGANCMCERYTMVENRQRGGFTEFEMQFVEVGTPGNMNAAVNTTSAIQNNSTAAEKSAKNNIDANQAVGAGSSAVDGVR